MTRALACALALALGASAWAQSADRSPETAWRLLDYVSVDYAGAVSNGHVASASEFNEMLEFTASAGKRIAALPPTPAQPELVQQADVLLEAVRRMAPPVEVARLAKKLAGDLLTAYPVPLAPSRVPDLARAASLYGARCAICHGPSGDGDGPAGVGLEPPPMAFSNLARARQRSVFGLYQVIGQGIDGTSMASFAQFSADDRWALALYVSGLAYSDSDSKHGEALWRSDSTLRARFPTLQSLVHTTPAELAVAIGDERARPLTAYLRHDPQAIAPPSAGTLAIARTKLERSTAAYAAGDHHAAADLALAAYLDGVEPVEPALSAHDEALKRRVEGAMGDFRSAIARDLPVAEVRAKSERVDALLDAAERTLSTRSQDWQSSFAGALMIVLREGLEALLIVVAMIAFLRKADRTDVMGYVHGGWIAALAAGGVTWAIATHLVSISGASRELTEGLGSVIAALVLVSVGIWMHGKGQADSWQRYVRESLSHALSRRSAWFLFGLAFVVVYREVFETILFFTALWSQGGGLGLLLGTVLAAVILGATATALLVYSRRLPISQFFKLSSILIAVLAVVLAGKGVAALQEAGVIDIWPIAILPRIELLGLYPTREGVLAQLATLTVMAVGFWYTSRSASTARVQTAEIPD